MLLLYLYSKFTTIDTNSPLVRKCWSVCESKRILQYLGTSSLCNYLYYCRILAPLLSLSIQWGTPMAGWDANKYVDREREEERVEPKRREIHEHPSYPEKVKSGTILDSPSLQEGERAQLLGCILSSSPFLPSLLLSSSPLTYPWLNLVSNGNSSYLTSRRRKNHSTRSICFWILVW